MRRRIVIVVSFHKPEHLSIYDVFANSFITLKGIFSTPLALNILIYIYAITIYYKEIAECVIYVTPCPYLAYSSCATAIYGGGTLDRRDRNGVNPKPFVFHSILVVEGSFKYIILQPKTQNNRLFLIYVKFRSICSPLLHIDLIPTVRLDEVYYLFHLLEFGLCSYLYICHRPNHFEGGEDCQSGRIQFESNLI